MAGTSFSTKAISNTNLSLTDQNGYGLFGDCTGAPDTTAGIYQHGCIIIRSDTSTGTVAVYQNTGSIAVPVWTLFDTALPTDSANSLVDTNSVVVLGVNTVASTVNGLMITGSATGAVSANGVLLAPGAPSGSDSAISLLLQAKGATGLITIGAATQSGIITVGNATTATTAEVDILSANATASTQTIVIGGGTSTTSGGKVVNIANGVPGASTTNAVNIGAGGTTTGTVAVTIGSVGNAAHTTLIQGGSGAAITLTPQTTGVILIGAAAGTGDVIVGSSSGAQSVKIGNGAGVATVNIANVSVAGAVVNVASAVTGAGITDTITIAGGNAAATGIKVVNILTGTAGTSGNNRLTMGGGTTSKVSINGLLTQSRVANYIATESGANNAIVGALTDASGTNVPLAAGLTVTVKLAHTLQAGGNTFDFNGGGAVAIKMHSNAASDLGVGYAATGIIQLIYDGTAWLDLSQ